ncbi:MAG: type II secretion system protein GspD [Puniceicoccaceae bacterium]
MTEQVSLVAWILCSTLALAGLEVSATSTLEEESLRLRDQGGIESLYGRRDRVTAEPGEDGSLEPEEGEVATPDLEDFTKRVVTRDEMLEEVDSTWMRPMVFERSTSVATSNEQDQILEQLESVFIPKVEFRELPLSQVVETLSELSLKQDRDDAGLNIVLIDPEGRDPRISILLRRLSLKRVLDFVVESSGCEYDLQKDAVVIRPRQGPGMGLETEFYPISRSTLIRLTGLPEMDEIVGTAEIIDPFAMPEAEPEDTRGEAESALKSFLQRAGIPFSGVTGADLALADGQLIVTQTPRNHEKVRQLLRRYREIRQVEIEARFLEVEERNLQELGLEWSLVTAGGDSYSNAPSRNLASAFTIGEDERRIVIDRAGVDLPGIGQGAPVLPVTVDLAEEAGDLLSVNSVIDHANLSVIMRALERQSGNDLLSAPKLTVLSGKTAEIVVADEFRYPENYGDTNAEVGRGDSNSGSAGVAITAGTPRSFTTRNVGVEMQVTPTVEEDNSVSLRLKPTVTEFEGFVEYGGTSVAIASDTTVTVPSGFYQPVFSVRKVDTEVTIWDGATVVMGGLTREHSVRIADKVPLLGDLPVLGRLFRQEGESTQKRNLLIFVTANLVSPGGSPAFQYLPGVEPNSLFQVPRLSTPAGMSERSR